MLGGGVMVFNATLLVEETGRKPPIDRKSLTNFFTYYCIEYTSP